MREKICLDKGWYCHIGDMPAPAKTVEKAGMIFGLANALESEAKEPYSGALRHMDRARCTLGVFGKKIEGETPFQEVLQYHGVQQPRSMDELPDWHKVDLPHDFRLETGYQTGARADQGHFAEGAAWYRKTFALAQEDLGARIMIEIDGAMRGASIWFNGCFVGDHYSGYSGFAYDLTELAKYGDEGLNVLLIRLDTSVGREGWWYEGGGLYRHVWLTKTAPVHVERWGVHVQSRPKGDGAVVQVHTSVENDLDTQADVTIETVLVSPEGENIPLARTQGQIESMEKGMFHQQIELERAAFWDVDNPALYTARVRVITGEGEQDVYETQFGVREIRYTREGLFLNGRHIQIKGACVHMDWAGVGIAQHDSISAYKIRRLKEMGCNAYRSAHNPATIELLQECDRRGMLVLDENRVPETTPERLRDLEEMIRRGRNHPCVFAWSMSNEEGFSGSPQAGRILKKYVSIVKKLDPDRMVLAAEANMFGEEAAQWCRAIYGVYGFNYPEALPDNVLYRQARKADPDLPIMSTENVSYLTTRGVYEDVPQRGHCSSYGTAYDQLGKTGGMMAGGAASPWQAMDFYRENPWTCGHFIWTGFDYRGETTPFFEHQTNSNYGVMDYCGFAKDTYYYYQAEFLQEPVLHILPHWSSPKAEGETVDVRVYTNCDEVELLLNGTTLGRRKKAGHWIGWQVPYVPGRLEAVGYRREREAIRDVRMTAGAPASVRLQADKTKMPADGASIAFAIAQILDENGVVVPNAENTVCFAVEGNAKVLGTGNGDPGSFEDDRLPARRAFGGCCMALVQAGEQAGKIAVTASAEGLRGDRIWIELA